VREINTICMDTGFYSEEAVAAVEKINKKGERNGLHPIRITRLSDFS